MKIAIIGAGWAGLAAAVQATLTGHSVVVFEASHAIGGRARAVTAHLADGSSVTLDNGQHILLGAYTETLRLMRLVGVDPEYALLRLPMTLLSPAGLGLQFPAWPTPLDALAAIVTARGWSVADKWSVLRSAARWQRTGFQCAASQSVCELAQGLSPRVLAELIEPLCLSALNTPVEHASAQVFLRVLRDALFGVPGGSRLLLPRVNLSELFPNAALRWLGQHGAQLHLGSRVTQVVPQGAQWTLGTASVPGANSQNGAFDAVIIATSAAESVRALDSSAQMVSNAIARNIHSWTRTTRALQFEAITTVYAWGAGAALRHPMLRLPTSTSSPAQFVFDRGQLGGPQGLLAFVVSASHDERETLAVRVLEQARQQLGLKLLARQTLTEKRATFACTPALLRPPQRIAPGLFAAGDYVAGPYPATLEGAVRSGVSAAKAATTNAYDAASGSPIHLESA